VGLLNELRPGIKFECISENGEQYNKFVMSVTVDNETFEGSGSSKKLAKTAAAKAVLAKLFSVSYNPFGSQVAGKAAGNGAQERLTLPQVLADHIGR